jgi:hypothetical protein
MGAQRLDVPRSISSPTPKPLGSCTTVSGSKPLGPALLDPELCVALPSSLRRLDPQEWVKINRLLTSWRPGAKATKGIAKCMGAHKWGSLGDFICHMEASHGKEESTHSPSNNVPQDSNTMDPLDLTSTEPVNDGWSWEPPDLGPGSLFYHKQIALLRAIKEE